MERRDFVGALAAIFCGVVLPEPVRETIRAASLEDVLWFNNLDGNTYAIWSKVPRDGKEAYITDYFQALQNPRSLGRIVGIDHELGEITIDKPLKFGPNNGILVGVSE